MHNYEYDIALSFAGEDRDIAEKIAMELVKLGIRVFYDDFEREKLWGEDLAEFFHRIYSQSSRYCVILVSKKYLEKPWTTHERRSALERVINGRKSYILPVKVEDVDLPGLPSTIGHVKWERSIDDLVGLIQTKLRQPESPPKSVPTQISAPQSMPSDSSVDDDPRILRHRSLSKGFFPNLEGSGYWAFHSLLLPEKEIPHDRFRSTFLDRNKQYSEELWYSRAPKAHQNGYTRRLEEELGKEGPKTVQATSCYFNGYVVTEGYLEPSLNPNWFSYEIQRHLQLSKEIFEGFAEELRLIISLRNIEELTWEIYSGGRIAKRVKYTGYHEDLRTRIAIKEISGRDRWNVVSPAVPGIMEKIARIFGMPNLPQRYWDNNDMLDYPRGIPGR